MSDAIRRLDRGIRPGSRGPGGRRAERGVLEQDVVDEGSSRPGGFGSRSVRSEREGERPARVGHHEGLEVVVRVHELVEARSTSSSGRGSSIRWIVKAGHAAQRDGGDRPECAEPGLRRPQLVALAELAQLAAAVHQPHADHARGDVPEARRRCRGWRWRSRRPGSAGRRRPGSPSEPARRSSSPSSRSVMPGLHGHVVAVLDGEHAPHPRRSSITPSVQAMSVNEWPEPATFTPRRPRHGAGHLLLRAGRSMRSGAQRCCRAQLVQRQAGHALRPSAPWATRPSRTPDCLARRLRLDLVRLRRPVGLRRRSACRAGRPRRRVPPCSPCPPRSRPGGRRGR